ncbi:MAG: GNAT family N-acetyltransferase [Burkholderiales bacterium]|nr:GNAT family N-acetyltransferase [Burkholderiales bacterium]
MSLLTFRRERPDQPEVVALLDALDAYLAGLYPPEANHILGVQALLAPEVSFYVARRDGVAVGTGALRLATGEGHGEIKRMYVVPAERGRGVAYALLQALEARARELGRLRLQLETGRDQRAAVRLYERCGYTRCEAFGGYPDNGLSLFMGKTL